jgi:hypothetical protein
VRGDPAIPGPAGRNDQCRHGIHDATMLAGGEPRRR